MSTHNPSIPPPPGPVLLPEHPFDQWLARQALAGHDRLWLQRNRAVLLKRWKGDDSDLPKPPPKEVAVPDRYSEV